VTEGWEKLNLHHLEHGHEQVLCLLETRILYLVYIKQYKWRKIRMGEDIRFYKGKHKVKVLSQSKGNWLVETLEPFEDAVYGKSVSVKAGERRVVAPNLLFKRKGLSPPIKEHTYELKMERKLKRFIKEKEETR
jgi:hypothetical protein